MIVFFATHLTILAVPTLAGLVYHYFTCKICKGIYKVKNHKNLMEFKDGTIR